MSVRDLEFSQMSGFKLISGGVAYNLSLDFQADYAKISNYTKAGTTASITSSEWYRGFPAGDAISIRTVVDNAATGNVSGVLETTNGVTDAGVASAFATQQVVISGATAANPPVVTTAAVHGMATGDRVRITKVIGMVELNNLEFKVTVLTTTTFSLQDAFGNDIDGSAFTAYGSSGQITKLGPDIGYTKTPATHVLTLGSAVMGADSDVLYIFVAKFAAGVKDLGDIG